MVMAFAKCDILCSSGVGLAERAQDLGVHVTWDVFNGMHQRKDQATTGSGRMRVFVGTGMHGLPEAQMMEEKVHVNIFFLFRVLVNLNNVKFLVL